MNDSFTEGVKRLEAGDAKAALQAFEASLANAEGSQKADSLYNIAICHCRLGNVDAAIAAVEQALTTDPNLATEIQHDDDFAAVARHARFQAALATAAPHLVEAGLASVVVAGESTSSTEAALQVSPEVSSAGQSDGGLKEYNDRDLNALTECERPVLIAFPWGNRPEPVNVVQKLAARSPFDTRFSFATVSASDSPKLVEQFGIRILPAIAVVLRGKPLRILSGVEQVTEGRAGDACTRVMSILDSPEPGPALENLAASARQSADAARKEESLNTWLMVVPFSGLVTGVVMAVSRANISGPGWLLATGLAYAFLILNGNLALSGAQKVVATLLALIVGRYGEDILRFLFTQQ